MELTTKSIITILPFQKELKDSLLLSFDTFDPDKKILIERIIWDFYEALYAMRLDENIKKALENSSQDNIKLDKAFYKGVKDKTDQEMLAVSVESIASVDLIQTREKLEDVIGEKQPASSN